MLKDPQEDIRPYESEYEYYYRVRDPLDYLLPLLFGHHGASITEAAPAFQCLRAGGVRGEKEKGRALKPAP